MAMNLNENQLDYGQQGVTQIGFTPSYGQPQVKTYSERGNPHPPQQSGYSSQYGYEMNSQGEYRDPNQGANGFDFSDTSIRHSFIQKVYTILSIQLSITFVFIYLSGNHEGTKSFLLSHPELLWVALVLAFVTIIAMSCCESVRRTAPTNFIFLGLFTAAESFLLGCLTIKVPAEIIMLAIGATVVVCLALTLFAFQTKIDFTVCSGALFVALILLMVFGLIAIFFPGKTINLIYASFGALLFSIYLIYDTQLLIGGNHKVSINPEEYIFAVLNIYLDIISLFIYLLMIISATSHD